MGEALEVILLIRIYQVIQFTKYLLRRWGVQERNLLRDAQNAQTEERSGRRAAAERDAAEAALAAEVPFFPPPDPGYGAYFVKQSGTFLARFLLDRHRSLQRRIY